MPDQTTPDDFATAMQEILRAVMVAKEPTLMALLDTLSYERRRRLLAVLCFNRIVAATPRQLTEFELDNILQAMCNYDNATIAEVANDVKDYNAARAIDRAAHDTPPASA